MQRPWRPSIYRTNAAQTASSPPAAIADLMKGVSACNERLRHNPYDAESWCKRASFFLALNFPELAAGDAYKASLLLDQAANHDHHEAKNTTSSDTLRDTTLRVRMYAILGQALYDAHCHWEAAEMWGEAAQKGYGEKAMEKARELKELLQRKDEAAKPLSGTAQEQKDRLRDGGVITIQYPWLESRHAARSPELVKLVNEELSSNLTPQACYVGHSSLAMDSSDDMLGMFAGREIHRDECILIDRTATGICSDPMADSCDNCYARVQDQVSKAPCCAVRFCSLECQNIAMNTYHKVLCGQDFRWLQQNANGLRHNASPLRPLMMLRFLAACIQANAHKSPLDHPLIARLQPLADRNHLDVFTLTESVITPIKILRQLGVDVFSNANFDTMILHTIWTRIANNKAGAFDPRIGFVDEITPFLPPFNHSCEPNVEWRRDEGSTTVRFFARQRIEKGEELFCSYIDVRHIPIEERVRRLWPWFEGPCLCSRCARES